MSVPFGFSVGDFIAVGTLLFEIGSALRDSTGASEEYQALLLRLDSLKQIMDLAAGLLSGSQLPSLTKNAILMYIGRCYDQLKRFNPIIENHKVTFSKGGSGNRVKDFWRKLLWNLITKEEIKEIENALGGYISAVNMLLTACGV
jgi:phosphoribosylformylglycinamidine (FGAM) synthase-like amidotransferase family enzyme